MGDDQGRELRLPAFTPRALSTRCHNWHAAASTASTERPSIKVSVVRWSKPGPNIVSGGSVEHTNAVRGPQGAYWLLGLGPNRPKVGVPKAAAMCISPVSLPMNSAQRAQHRRRGQQIDPADQIDQAIDPDSAASSGCACPRSCSAASTTTRAPGSGPSQAVSRRASSAKRSARHCLPRQFAAGPIASTGPPAGSSAAAARSCRGAVHSLRAGRRVEVEQAAELPHAMFARVAFGHDPAARPRAAARPAPSRANRRQDPIAGRRLRHRAGANAVPSAASPR